MIPAWLISGASAALPSIVDSFTGASKKKRDAMDAYGSEMDNEISSLNNEMGNGVTDSLMYKTGVSVLDKSQKKLLDNVDANAASGGLTDEAKLGTIAGVNDNYNSAIMKLLGDAEARRQQLKREKTAALLRKLGFNMDRANETVNSQNQLVGGLSGLGLKYGMSKMGFGGDGSLTNGIPSDAGIFDLSSVT